MTRTFREITATLRAHGVEILACRRNRHPVFRCRHAGTVFTLTAPSSPSDHRWRQNLIRDLRKEMRARS